MLDTTFNVVMIVKGNECLIARHFLRYGSAPVY